MTMHSTFARFSNRRTRAIALSLLLAALFAATATTAGKKFYDDDPIAREPETQSASGAVPQEVGLIYELGYGLFVTRGRPSLQVRAGNVNTIDEVPDSSWFTNRIGTRPLSIEELVRGPQAGPPPAPGTWTVIRPKSAGASPGFTARDPSGEDWFVTFDAPSAPEGGSAALLIANKIFWALGYNQVENFISSIKRDSLVIAETATQRRPSGKRTPMTDDDLSQVFERSARNADGVYRFAAARALKGKVLNSFLYAGTRSDDPNDLVRHEHRRELRALQVFGAWTNLVDMKAGNTLDLLIEENGRGIIKHYLQDVGSTFGIGANGPHAGDEGWEYLYEGGATLRRLFSFGFALSPWQTIDYEDYKSVGIFEGDRFDPRTWRPRVPNPALIQIRDDDAFWAARRVMAFSDEMIRAIVKTGQLSDPKAEEHLANVLIKRRNKIGQAYLTGINPVVSPALDASGTLTFANAAVDAGFAKPPASYKVAWSRFDNTTGQATAIAETTAAEPRVAAPSGLPTGDAYIKAEISCVGGADPSWAKPVDAYFRHDGGGWKLVGLERLPASSGPPPAAKTSH